MDLLSILLLELFQPFSGDEEPSSWQDDRTSPQHQAVEWLIDDDSTDITTLPVELLEERYILAVLYFATGGADWYHQWNFLATTSVCTWNDHYGGIDSNNPSSPKKKSRFFGIDCDTYGFINKIILGEICVLNSDHVSVPFLCRCSALLEFNH